MKRFLLMLGAAALMTACSEDNEGTGGNGDIDYEEGYRYLSSLNVSDAKFIYQKGEEGDYFKLDVNGNESRLVIKGEDGQDHNIGFVLEKLSDRVLRVVSRFSDVSDLLPKPDPDMGHVAFSDYCSFVDMQTGKMYKCKLDLYPKEDNQGNLYFYTSVGDGPAGFYKLNVTDFTMELISSYDFNFMRQDFEVIGDGFIFIYEPLGFNDNIYIYRQEEIVCPDVSVQDVMCFILDGNLYSVRGDSIIKYETSGKGSVVEKVICQIQIPEHCYPKVMAVNHVHNAVLLYLYRYGVSYDIYVAAFEFNGEKCTMVDIPPYLQDYVQEYPDDDVFYINPDFYDLHNNRITSKAWYFYRWSDRTFIKTAMKDYQRSEFRVEDYKIQTLSMSPESPDISFTGTRDSDGADVIGIINENDEVKIVKVAENGERITGLIVIN